MLKTIRKFILNSGSTTVGQDYDFSYSVSSGGMVVLRFEIKHNMKKHPVRLLKVS